jgi:hypothetical protein
MASTSVDVKDDSSTSLPDALLGDGAALFFLSGDSIVCLGAVTCCTIAALLAFVPLLISSILVAVVSSWLRL